MEAGTPDLIKLEDLEAAAGRLTGRKHVLSILVENRPGAGGMIGQTFVAKSAPDGYTLLLAGGSMAGARYVNANMGYDLLRDFTPVSLLETSPFVLVVNPALPARSAGEFIALARSRPGKMTFGTLGAGQIPFWSVALFNSMAAGTAYLNIHSVQFGSGEIRGFLAVPAPGTVSLLALAAFVGARRRRRA